MIDLNTLRKRFPKVRAPLPEPYQKILFDEYRANRKGQGFAFSFGQMLERWMHRRVSCGPAAFPLLEIGAGTLNHVVYEPEDGLYDAVEPWADLYLGEPDRSRIRTIYPDVDEIPAETHYARIVSIATLEHIIELPHVLIRCAQLLAPGGVLRAGIPSEGSPLWSLAWRCGTGTAFRWRTGLAYGTLMRHEHVNCAREIIDLTGHFFREVRLEYFPLPFFAASLYVCIHARLPDLTAIEQFKAGD